MNIDTTSMQTPRPVASVSLPPTNKTVHKILFLDGLRGLAAMLVVAHHAGYFHGHGMGAPAVDVFFVLSAFLLTLIFEKKVRQLVAQNASHRRWRLALGDYVARRFLRVYPLFAVVATVLAVLPAEERTRSLKMNHPERYNLLKVLLLFVPNSHPHILWSLPVEISYYFFLPVVVVVAVRLDKRWWVLALAGLVVVVVNGVYQWPYRQRHTLVLAHYPTLLCGSLGALVFAQLDAAVTTHNFTWTRTRVYALRTVELVVGVLLLSMLFDGLLFHWIATNPLPDTNHFVSLPVTVLIVCEMLQRGPLSSVLEWSLLRFAGKVSFSMYLLHVFVVDAEFVRRAPFYDRFFLLWTLVLVLSTASYYAIERPCQRAAARIGQWIKQQDAVAAAAEAAPRSHKKEADLVEIEIAHTAKAF